MLSISECYSQNKFYNIQVAIGTTVRSSVKGKEVSGKYYPFTYELFGFNKYHFSLDVKKKLIDDKLTLQLSNNITYGFLRRGTTPFGTTFDETSLRRDHFIDIFFTKKNKGKFPNLLFGAGYGVMNAGTNFNYSKPYNNNAGNISLSGTLQFMAPRVMVGLEKGVFNAFLIANYTGRDSYYNKTNAYNAEVKLTITFPKFKKIGK
jgi:hypothetical protein